MKHWTHFIILIAVFCPHAIGALLASDVNDSGLVAELRNLKVVERDHQCLEVDFVLKNVSSKPIALAERWNSWGAHQWSFKLTDAKGNIFRFDNPQSNWFANFLSLFTIPPDKATIFKCRLSLGNRGFQDKDHYLFSQSTGFMVPENPLERSFPPDSHVEILKLSPNLWSYPIELEGIFSAPVIQQVKHGKQKIETNWKGEISTSKAKLTGIEQDGADQPATAPEPKPEGKEKPKPETKALPQ